MMMFHKQWASYKWNVTAACFPLSGAGSVLPNGWDFHGRGWLGRAFPVLESYWGVGCVRTTAQTADLALRSVSRCACMWKCGMCQSMVCIKASTGRESSCFGYTGRSALQGKAKAEGLDSESGGWCKCTCCAQDRAAGCPDPHGGQRNGVGSFRQKSDIWSTRSKCFLFRS